MEPNNLNDRLRELHSSGYEIVDGQPNIIGWSIRDNANHKIGVVDDLLFDAEQQKVRYIIANLKDNDFDLDKRKVLVPIGVAKLHENKDDVVLSSISAWQLRALPTYNKRLTDSDEDEIFTVFSTTTQAPQQGMGQQYQRPQNFYEQSQFNHDNLFESRRVGPQSGEPINRSFRIREGDTVNAMYKDNVDHEDHVGEKEKYEPEENLIGNRQPGTDEFHNERRQPEADNDRLLTRIKKMQNELSEIEKDLKKGRVIY